MRNQQDHGPSRTPKSPSSFLSQVGKPGTGLRAAARGRTWPASADGRSQNAGSGRAIRSSCKPDSTWPLPTPGSRRSSIRRRPENSSTRATRPRSNVTTFSTKTCADDCSKPFSGKPQTNCPASRARKSTLGLMNGGVNSRLKFTDREKQILLGTTPPREELKTALADLARQIQRMLILIGQIL